MEEEKKEQIGFFKRIKISIFNFDEYQKLVDADFFYAMFLHLFFFIIILAIAVSIGVSVKFYKMSIKGFDFLKTLPDFKYVNGAIETNEYAEGYDDEYSTFFVLDTSKTGDVERVKEEVDSFSVKSVDAKIKIFLFKKGGMIKDGELEIPLYYSAMVSNNEFNNYTKADLISDIESLGLVKLSLLYGVYVLFMESFSVYISLIILLLIPALYVKILSRAYINKEPLKFFDCYKVVCYATSIPFIFMIIYTIVNNITGFEISNYSDVTSIIEIIIITVATYYLMKNAPDRVPIESEEDNDDDNTDKEKIDENEEKEFEELREEKKKKDEKKKDIKDKEEKAKKEAEKGAKEKAKEPEGSEA